MIINIASVFARCVVANRGHSSTRNEAVPPIAQDERKRTYLTTCRIVLSFCALGFFFFLSVRLLFYFMFRSGRWPLTRDLQFRYDQSIEHGREPFIHCLIYCIANVKKIKRISRDCRLIEKTMRATSTGTMFENIEFNRRISE